MFISIDLSTLLLITFLEHLVSCQCLRPILAAFTAKWDNMVHIVKKCQIIAHVHQTMVFMCYSIALYKNVFRRGELHALTLTLAFPPFCGWLKLLRCLHEFVAILI